MLSWLSSGCLLFPEDLPLHILLISNVLCVDNAIKRTFQRTTDEASEFILPRRRRQQESEDEMRNRVRLEDNLKRYVAGG